MMIKSATDDKMEAGVSKLSLDYKQMSVATIAISGPSH